MPASKTLCAHPVNRGPGPLRLVAAACLALLLGAALTACGAAPAGPPAVPDFVPARASSPAASTSEAAIPPALQEQGRRIRFEHLTPDDGLSQSVVLAMVQDDEGFLWFATQDGLNRYDGGRFKVFKADPAAPERLSDSFIMALDRDAAGRIWIGTNSGGLYAYEPAAGRFTPYRHDPADAASISEDAVSAVYVAADGMVWAGTAGSGLNRLDPHTGSFVRFVSDPDDDSTLAPGAITSITEDRAGMLWVGSNSGGLARLDRSTGVFTRFRSHPDDPGSLSSSSIQKIYVDRQGTLWAGTVDSGLNRYLPDSEGFARYLPDPADPAALAHPWIYTLYEDSHGVFWVGTNGGGLQVLDRATGRFATHRHDPLDANSLVNDGVQSILEDASGILWFGTFGGGVDRYDRQKEKFLLLRSDPAGGRGPADDQVWSVLEDSQGRLWVGSNTRGLSRLDLTTGAWTYYRADPADPTSLGGDGVYSLYEDRAGRVWAGTDGRLSRFDPATGAFTQYDAPPFQFTLYEDRAGRFWVGTAVGLALVDRESGAARVFLHDPGDPASISSNSVAAIGEDETGALWIGCGSGGLNRLDPDTGRFERYRHDPDDPESISSDGIIDLHPVADGVLWIGTTGGLNRLDTRNGRATAFREKDGLPNDFVYRIEEDEAGGLWLSTNRGLARFDPATAQFRTYGRADGLQGNEFNQGASFRGRSGVIYFGGIAGLNAFHPALVKDDPFVPPVVITGFSLRHQPVSPGPDSPLSGPIEASRQITLSHTQGFFELEYAALHYAAPEENRYATIMEGLDRDWVDAGNRAYAEYTNVPPGRYTFRVLAGNRDGVWNTEGAALAIVIPPPFWQTTWFRLLMALAGLGIVSGGVAVRLRSVEQQRRRLEQLVDERTRQLQDAMGELARARDAAEAGSRAKSAFLANMSHEFRTPLNAIIGFTQVLTRDRSLGSEPRENLEIIHRSSEHLLGLINDVLEMSKIEAGRTTLNTRGFDLHRMLAGLQEMFALRAGRKGLVLGLELAEDTPRYLQGDEGKLRQVLMNLLGNAVKFTERGKVTLRVLPAQGQAAVEPGAATVLRFEVQDTGPGIAAEDAEKLFEPFVQAESGRQSQEGTGLGLAISQQFVRLMGGEIRVISEPGRGSTFRFELPATAISAGELETPPPERRVVGLEPGQAPCRMLVVDDREINRKLLVKLLAPAGFEVREAANGQEALEAWQAWEPHLILMDMRMPVMDGYEATRRIKATTQGQSTVVIALTASALEEERAVILSEGCDDYLRKPLREGELFDAIERHLGVRFIYEELAAAVEAAAPAVPEEELAGLAPRLAAAGPDWLADLEHATILGDLEAIARLAASAPDAGLAGPLAGLAARFEHDRILALIAQARSSEPHATESE